MDSDQTPPPPSYAAAGVDELREQDVFARAMRPWLARTVARSPMVTSITGLASGYFATILQLEGAPPIAMSTDGVGTKILLAREANRWEPIGIDCVANNVNDLICVGAVPLALLDYVATDRIDEGVLEEIARGLYLGADLAGIAIPGGEIAQIGSMLADASGGRPMLDLVGTAIGALPPGRDPIDGSGVRAGDVIIGLPSSGLHSNGYSLARHVLFGAAGMKLADRVPGTARHLDDALLQPTRVYVAAVQALWAAGVEPRGLVNISGGGLLNLGRLAADVSYELDALPPPPPVFGLIADAGNVPAATMYATFNMGTGFAIVVPAARQQAAVAALKSVGEEPARVGWVTGRPGRAVSIPSAGLRGRGDTFQPIPVLRPRRRAASVAVKRLQLRGDSREAGRRQRRRVQVQRPDLLQQDGELLAQPGNPVQDDDLARAQRLTVPGLDAVARHGGAPAGQGGQPGPGGRHLHRFVEGPVRRAADGRGLAQPAAQIRPVLPPLGGGRG